MYNLTLSAWDAEPSNGNETDGLMTSQTPLFGNGSRWRHQMETFSALLALCAENSSVTGEFLTQRPVVWSFDVFFDLCLNKQLNKQSWVWWLETPSCSLWRHCNDEWFHPTLYNICNYLSMLGLKLIHVCKRDGSLNCAYLAQGHQQHSCWFLCNPL